MPTPDLSPIHNLLSQHAVSQDLLLVRFNSRAKRLIFKSSKKKGGEIVVPPSVDSAWVVEMTQKKIPWIKSAQQHARVARSQLNPTQIDLKALDETWWVDYRKTDEVPKRLMVNGKNSLTVATDPNDVFSTSRKLQSWFHEKARASLEPWLVSLAGDRSLMFNTIYVKNQVSLWGSCSLKRNINLNRNLLFLPRHLVEYVLHHELTHLDHLNHSSKFWNSFTRVVPNCKEMRRELRSRNPDDIPLWASPGLGRV